AVYHCLPVLRPPPTSTLFPYTTLFRSTPLMAGGAALVCVLGFSLQMRLALTPAASSGVMGAARVSRTIARLFTRSAASRAAADRSEEHTSELQSPCNLVCRLLLEKKKR